MSAPDDHMIRGALEVAALSPCRSKRGVVIYDPSTGAFRGAGHNSPPAPFGCPGRAICAGTCGQRSVHAEVRALREAVMYRRHHPAVPLDLVHVELAADGGAVACEGPSCWQCSREILDVGFVVGVWLYEAVGARLLEQQLTTATPITVKVGEAWRRYTAEEFHCATLARCGMVP
jgi:hypothetical protein